ALGATHAPSLPAEAAFAHEYADTDDQRMGRRHQRNSAAGASPASDCPPAATGGAGRIAGPDERERALHIHFLWRRAEAGGVAELSGVRVVRTQARRRGNPTGGHAQRPGTAPRAGPAR